ncbi:MAG: Crp/Fnr family transcriptional regulator [Eubacteriales bacterium]|nr:Crp/Fnr family transcriptional regulator [Eubacteriales bacterium]
MIRRLDTEQREYLNRYFAHAPESLMTGFQAVRIPEGTTFINEGEAADRVFILLKGRVAAVDYRVRETVYGFTYFHPVEVFGVMEILGHMDRYKTTLAAAEDSVFLRTSRERFEGWIKNDAEALQMETRKIIGYLLEQSRKERLYVLLPGNERVYMMLTNLYRAYGKGGTYSVYMSRKDFAEVTGLSERTVTRALKELEDRGCITRDGWNIVMTKEQHGRIAEMINDQINEMGE